MANPTESEANASPLPANPAPSPSAPRHRNHLIWLGPLLVFTGMVSYFEVFTRFPVWRDFPWINLPWILLGMILSAAGLWRAFGRPSRYRGKILGSLGLVFSLTVGGLFCFYVFYFSYTVPAPTETSLDLVQAPDFRLQDQSGKTVQLTDFRGKKVVLVFYRGYW
jgi:AhpC/TSA family